MLKNLIQLQQGLGDIKENLPRKQNGLKICGVAWKKIKNIVMAGDINDYTKIRIPLEDHEILLLLRYIEAEKQEPDFIKKGLADNF